MITFFAEPFNLYDYKWSHPMETGSRRKKHLPCRQSGLPVSVKNWIDRGFTGW